MIPLPAALRVCLLVLVGSFFGSIPTQAGNVSSPVTRPRLTFAIDDFGMDGRPNLSTAEPVSNSASLTLYRIHVQFGEGGRQSAELLNPYAGHRRKSCDLYGNDIPC